MPGPNPYGDQLAANAAAGGATKPPTVISQGPGGQPNGIASPPPAAPNPYGEQAAANGAGSVPAQQSTGYGITSTAQIAAQNAAAQAAAGNGQDIAPQMPYSGQNAGSRNSTVNNQALGPTLGGGEYAGENVYGNTVGGTGMYQQAYEQDAAAAATAAAPTANYGTANALFQKGQGNATQAQQAYGQAQGTIAQQQGNLSNYGNLYGQLMSESQGNGPNPAALASKQATQQGIQAQMAMAGSTRGSAGAGVAQLQAQQQGAQMTQANAANTGIQTAQQQLAAQQQASGVLNSQQQAMQGITSAQQAQVGSQYQGMGLQQQAGAEQAQMALSQAQLQGQQNSLNQQGALGWTQAEQNVNAAQLQANLQTEGLVTNAGLQQQQINNQNNQAWTSAALSGLGSIGAAAGTAVSQSNQPSTSNNPSSDIRGKEDIKPEGKPYGQLESDAHEPAPYVPQRDASGRLPYGHVEAHDKSPHNRYGDDQLQALIEGGYGHVNPAGERAMAPAPDPRWGAQRPQQMQTSQFFAPNPALRQQIAAGAAAPQPNVYGPPAPEPVAMAQPYGQVSSDERGKYDAQGEPAEGYGIEKTSADRFLDTLEPFSYRYKDPANEPTDQPTGGHYLGVMAQNVERGPTGDTIVKDGPRGKYLEGGALTSALAAGTGRLHERVSELERRQPLPYGIVREETSHAGR